MQQHRSWRQVRQFVWMVVLLQAAFTWAGAGSARAQSYPNRPVRFIVPFPGGSATDGYMRILMEKTQAALGQPIIVEPRPGAGAIIGAQYVMNQPADGYTILMYTTSHAIRSAAANPPFDVRKDFIPVIQNAGGALYLSVNAAKMPVRTVKELVEYAKANPGKVNFSSYGPNTLGHLGALHFASLTGINVVHVPYNGSSANTLALSMGDAHVTIDVLSSLQPHVQSGKVRILAAGNAERFDLTPDIPGMRESGYDMNIVALNGVAAKAGTPDEAVQKFNAAVNAGLRDKTVVDYFSRIGQKVYGGTPEEFRVKVNAEYDTWAKVIRDNNIKFD